MRLTGVEKGRKEGKGGGNTDRWTRKKEQTQKR
jgi:hypothetical protein